MADRRRQNQLSHDEILWRRVPPNRLKWGNDDSPRVLPQSNAFRARGTDDGVSVDRASLHRAAGRGPGTLLAAPECDERWGVLETTVAICAKLGFDVIEDPIDGNKAHALIVPLPTSGKSKKLTESASWIVTPPMVS